MAWLSATRTWSVAVGLGIRPRYREAFGQSLMVLAALALCPSLEKQGAPSLPQGPFLGASRSHPSPTRSHPTFGVVVDATLAGSARTGQGRSEHPSFV